MSDFCDRCELSPALCGCPNHPTVELFLGVLDEVRDLHLKKSRDYGSDGDPYANVRATEGWGVPAWAGAMLRANDKIVRLQSYVRNGQLANEGVEDSLIDIAVYASIALALWREQTQDGGVA